MTPLRRSPSGPAAGDPDPVPFLDLPREHEAVRGALEDAVLEVVRSGRYALGPAVERFESAVAAYLGVRHAVGVASGTDALLLSLRALGIGSGDEVVTTPFSFFATAGAIVHAGATPAFADIRPDTLNLDPDAVAAAVGPRTAAILPVHLFGQMADMPALRRVAERHGIALLEDAAQAMGAAQSPAGPDGEDAVSPSEDAPAATAGSARPAAGAASRHAGAAPEGWRKAGTLGHAGAFSFYPTKNLGGLGDGGLVTTDDDALADAVRRLRVHGRARGDEEYVHGEIGYNSRLDALQAAALRVKLAKLDEWNGGRRRHARAYDEALRSAEGVETPVERPGNHHVFHQYTVRCRERGAAMERLERERIGHAVFYPVPLHLQEAVAGLGHGEGDFPVAERAAREVLSVPVFPSLREGERRRVAEVLRGASEG